MNHEGICCHDLLRLCWSGVENIINLLQTLTLCSQLKHPSSIIISVLQSIIQTPDLVLQQFIKYFSQDCFTGESNSMLVVSGMS